jgi:hypothetical protein
VPELGLAGLDLRRVDAGQREAVGQFGGLAQRLLRLAGGAGNLLLRLGRGA